MSPTMREIVLASASPYRRRLLERLGLAFATDAADLDESPLPAEAPSAMVLRLSRAKAAAVAMRHPGALIIASDQCGVLAGRLLNKPGNHATACEQLRAASGNEAQFLTGLCVLDAADGRERNAVETCRVSFRSLSEAMIEDYVRREQPLDCAGSFKVEGLGIALFDRLELPDPTALEGLPLIRLVEFLGDLGAPVLST
jgi:septum formation protein